MTGDAYLGWTLERMKDHGLATRAVIIEHPHEGETWCEVMFSGTGSVDSSIDFKASSLCAIVLILKYGGIPCTIIQARSEREFFYIDQALAKLIKKRTQSCE